MPSRSIPVEKDENAHFGRRILSSTQKAQSPVEALRSVANLVHPTDCEPKAFQEHRLVKPVRPAQRSAGTLLPVGSPYPGRCKICLAEKSGLRDVVLTAPDRYPTDSNKMSGVCPDCLKIIDEQIRQEWIRNPGVMLKPAGPDPQPVQTPPPETDPHEARKCLDKFLSEGRDATESLWPELWASGDEVAEQMLLKLRSHLRNFWKCRGWRQHVCAERMCSLYRGFMLRRTLQLPKELRNPPSTLDAKKLIDAHGEGGLDAVRNLLEQRDRNRLQEAFDNVAVLLVERESQALDQSEPSAFELAVAKLRMRANKAKGQAAARCKYTACKHPYFFKTAHRKQYCSTPCFNKNVADRDREYWSTKGRLRRTERLQEQKRKHE